MARWSIIWGRLVRRRGTAVPANQMGLDAVGSGGISKHETHGDSGWGEIEVKIHRNSPEFLGPWPYLRLKYSSNSAPGRLDGGGGAGRFPPGASGCGPVANPTAVS